MMLCMHDVRLLCDPWFSGTAFSGGWGLHYENPQALEQACSATHLWISHWHSDHLHAPTLAELAARRPDLCVLANQSANFSMLERVRSFGFSKVLPVPERETLSLGEHVNITRQPTAGIDNMLHIKSAQWSVLNYNDCNLPARALRAVCKRVGKVDLLLTNYNHAGKLFARSSVAQIKDTFWDALAKVIDVVQPQIVVPFASAHYYRTAWSCDQNQSLLQFDELQARAGADRRFVILRIGDSVRLASGEHSVTRRDPPLAPSAYERHNYGDSVPWPELIEVADQRSFGLAKHFPLLGRLMTRPLRIGLQDLGRAVLLRVGQAAEEVAPNTLEIVTHSRALYDWLGRRFGDDTFFDGAHFEIVSEDTRAVRAWALITLLEGSHLDPRSLLGYCADPEGRRFLLHRGEELWATLRDFRLKAGQLRV